MAESRLRPLGWSARAGLSFALLTLLGGFAASLAHLERHHENRDGRPGVSMEDLMGAYHGVQTTSPMVLAIESGHPEGLDADARERILAWLASDRISDDYDNLDLGDLSPAELLAENCVTCHARSAGAGSPGSPGSIGESLPLEYWDDVEKHAFSRSLEPAAIEILIVSTHTHALALATITLLVGGLLLLTRWPRALCNALVFAAGATLFFDLAAQWLLRSQPSLLIVLVVAGAGYVAATVVSTLAVICDLWLPARDGSGSSG